MVFSLKYEKLAMDEVDDENLTSSCCHLFHLFVLTHRLWIRNRKKGICNRRLDMLYVKLIHWVVFGSLTLSRGVPRTIRTEDSGWQVISFIFIVLTVTTATYDEAEQGPSTVRSSRPLFCPGGHAGFISLRSSS
jgi:hypothetical protein